MRILIAGGGTVQAALLVAIGTIALGSACATAGGVPDRAAVDEALRGRINHGIRVSGDEAMPPGVLMEDGLSAEEAVAIALWNNPGFQVALTDLGFARADLIEARQLRNPILSLLFPWGPKQFEATLQLPIEAIWQRPKRVKAASLDADAVAARLMADGLGVMAQARGAYLTATAADARVRLAAESAELWGRLRNIADARLREGDISEFEARSIRSEAAMADAFARGADGDKEISRIELENILGYAVPPSAALAPVDDLRLSKCESIDRLIADALASRPDVRAAELAVEAAGARVGLERSKIVTLTANLDANGEGKDGFEIGPGLGLDWPLNGNAGARAPVPPRGCGKRAAVTWPCRRRCEQNCDRAWRDSRALARCCESGMSK